LNFNMLIFCWMQLALVYLCFFSTTPSLPRYVSIMPCDLSSTSSLLPWLMIFWLMIFWLMIFLFLALPQ
jgi:hypothetical protein